MNITFLIGNGFDVGLGLHSKFSDYFPLYIKESKDKKGTLSGLANEIDSDIEEWSYFEKKMGEYTEKFSKKTIADYKAQIKDFEVSFIEYLQAEENLLVYDKTKISQVFEKALLNFYKNGNLSPGSTDAIANQFTRFNAYHYIFNFISFNYTDSLEKCLMVFSDGIISKRRFNNTEYFWWHLAAWPVNNFIKNNDFTNKTVIPFATSASSGLGDSGTLLAQMAGTGNWQEGHRFSSGALESDVRNWVQGLNLAA